MSMNTYKKITKRELSALLDKFSDDEEFNVIQTKLGVEIIPIGQKFMSKTEIFEIADKSKTMIYSENKFLSQVDMHTKEQDILNIDRGGALNTLLLPKASY